MTCPTISVIIPTKNRNESVLKSIKSIINQTVMPNEIIIVDDGSDLAVNLEDFKIPITVDAKIIRNEISVGAAAARNQGIIETKCEWVAFLDDDDIFHADKIEKIHGQIILDPSCGLIYHPSIINCSAHQLSYCSGTKRPPEVKILENIIISNFIGGTSMVVVKKENLIDVNGFDHLMPAKQDHDLWVRLIDVGIKISYIEEPLTEYNLQINGGSISSNLEKRRKAQLLFNKKHKGKLDKLNKSQKENYAINILLRNAFDCLLADEKLMAAKIYITVGVKRFNIKYLLLSFLSLFGIKVILFIRQYFK